MRRLEIASGLRVDIDDAGIAEVVLGPAGGMPTTDVAGHAAMADLWPRLAKEPGVRCILVRSEGKGFCAGGDMALVEEMLGSESARLRVMREARALVQGMIDFDLPIVSAINGAAVAALGEKRPPRFAAP